MTRHKAVTLALAGAALVLLPGCGADRALLNERLTTHAYPSKPLVPDQTYTVAPPDVLHVEFTREPELTRDVQIRSDGVVVLPLVEDVQVADMTTVAIRKKLEELYSTYHKEPQILVAVSEYRSKVVFVYGEVGREGSLPYTGSQTVADVLGAVGGVTRRSSPGRVKVIRPGPKGGKVFKVDVTDLILGGDMAENVSLAENDVIRVPPNFMSWLGYQLENLLFPITNIVSGTQNVRTFSGPGTP